MTEITGRTAVVTGGGSGIGMGLAKALATAGARVAVADIMLSNAQGVVDTIRAEGGQAIAVECDVCERSSIQAMKTAVHDAYGPVQLLFANAGATSFDPLVEMSDEDVDWILQVNLHGVINTTRAFLPDMIAAGGGHICATSSMAGLLPGWIPVHAPYSAAKAGVIGLMMNLALEVAEYDIHTTSYCPGGVATGMKVNNSRYRPARFGGPADGGVQVGEASSVAHSHDFYTPEAVAPMVLDAVRHNRAFVFDHPAQRAHFRTTYSAVVEACYDAAEQWHDYNGTPDANPHGAVLLKD
ncbi:NAD(P)-dependent dehydrogenase (short-subunit alcohol dehydrogenase family) [Novosphingobium chloroacetimidivorans]|uniref:NAD(P)-dependent dehydrogenase (Short-subunit alcohol dehydrogenase family) n=1 Tax=Novosphingobium chloroacetimidivorans TaxID=1428314 RepID=A0A7W7KDU4_9SPHN|nr:SDR family oxidoreductase [Novosphingobium chloroacetimidivorans]MBB4860655.1 NAD(P)-dependent dehydrogenase (short-subunit alcohol dehydrogenase family) [Novosphingobium chloroacetimidivorans]